MLFFFLLEFTIMYSQIFQVGMAANLRDFLITDCEGNKVVIV